MSECALTMKLSFELDSGIFNVFDRLGIEFTFTICDLSYIDYFKYMLGVINASTTYAKSYCCMVIG